MESIESIELGIVYILTNPAMSGMIKIGQTSKADMRQRMNQLHTTGVPVPFECPYAAWVKNKDSVEKALHKAFAPYRVNPKREFFRIEVDQAKHILELLAVSDATPNVALEIKNSTDAESIEAGERIKAKRPRLNFAEMGIQVGSVLCFKRNHSITVQVAKENRVCLGDETISLTEATRQLLGNEYNVQPTPYWTYNGRNLIDIYYETYPLDGL